jgi:hypothetical protein
MNPAASTEQWYRVIVPAAERNTRAKTIQDDFQTLYSINGTPNGAALFTCPATASGCDSLYFSPGAVAIARGLILHFSGEPCPPPVAEGDNPVLLVGHRDDERDLLLRSAENSLKSGVRRKLDRILGRE